MEAKQRVRRYFRNLIAAMFGNNPYQIELNRLSEEYEKAADNVKQLEEYYWLFKAQQAEVEQQVASYQTLVDNLRKRLEEKDEMMEQMKAEYNKSIASLCETIERLKKEMKDE
jgi:dipeptidase